MSLLAEQSLWSPTSIQVTVLQARGLRIKGKSGTNDAFAVMQVGKEKYATSVVEKSVAPVWKEEAAFDLPPLHQRAADRCALQVHVLHRALVGPDKLLGQTTVNLLQLSEDQSRNKTEWFKLLDKAGKSDKDRGEVLLDIQFLRNNMTASMFDLSAAGKQRSRLGKLKDKVRGKKKDELTDTTSNVVPSLGQVLTDSEEEEGHGGDVAVGKEEKKSKKKQKLKSLFSTKSNLQRNMSQSMSVLPAKNSSLTGSSSSGLNVDSSEGKKKFKFMIHKRSGSSDSKESQGSFSSKRSASSAAEQSNVCINGSHVYCEERQPRSARAGSAFSLSSSGRGSMEDLQSGQAREGSTASSDSLRLMRQYSPWTEEEEEEQTAEEERVEVVGEEEVKGLSKMEMIRQGEEEVRVEEERRREEEKVREEEQERRRAEEEERVRKEEERRGLEEQERRRAEEEERIRAEEERVQEEIRKRREESVRRQEEEQERLTKERKMQEEQERRRVEEERVQEEIRMRQEESVRRQEEEQERLAKERKMQEEQERRRVEEERVQEEIRRRQEEEESVKRLEEEQERLTKERKMQEEQERRRVEEERVQEEIRRRQEEEESVKRLEEEQERLTKERKMQEEQERRRVEEERVQEEIRRREGEERLETRKRRQEEEEERFGMQERVRLEEKRLKEEEEERRRVEEEERIRIKKQERNRLEEERRHEEEERARREEEEAKRRQEQEERRKEQEEIIRREEEERIRMEEEERVRLAEQKRKLEEQENMRVEEEEKSQRKEEEERLRMAEVRRRKEEEGARREIERLAEERRRLAEQQRRAEEEERARKEKERLAEEKRRLEEERLRMEEKKGSKEFTSTNPFDEEVSEEEDLKSPAEQRLQREKRPAPKPPLVNQPESQKEQQNHSMLNLLMTVQSPEGQNVTDPEHSQVTTGKSVQHNKGPAPAKPPSSSRSVQASGSGSAAKQVPVVFGLNPFEDDNETGHQLTAQESVGVHSQRGRAPTKAAAPQIPDKDSTTLAKVKAPAPAPAPTPANRADTFTDQTAIQGHSEPVQETSAQVVLPPSKDQPVTAESLEEAGGKREKPPVSTRRLLPVKPLNPSAQPPINNPSSVIVDEPPGKTEVSGGGQKRPYSQLTLQELVSLVQKQEKQLSDRDRKISQLEQYIDNLLVRVMEEKPSILMSLGTLKC
ncbi:uncharacterized protein LOC143011043 isoform X2 [Genypterus blacodes]|uniref:uncharacterized protein LOC143011043 isoform X2 n=1 Tax=Genypterus blacodes TaxID=154954 RepID=UPI003F7756A2